MLEGEQLFSSSESRDSAIEEMKRVIEDNASGRLYVELEAISDSGTLKKTYNIEGKVSQAPTYAGELDYPAIEQWLDSALGTEFDGDGVYGPQCVDFANAYATWLGHPLEPSDAADIWSIKQDSFWVKVPYKSGTRPQLGDLVVWGPWEDNPDGHVSVAFESHDDHFISVDQNINNQDGNNGAKKVKHEYSNPDIYGYLRPSL